MYYNKLAERLANALYSCGISSNDIEKIKKIVRPEFVSETIEFIKMIEDYEEKEE